MGPVFHFLALGVLGFIVFGIPLLCLGFCFGNREKPASGKARIARGISGGVFLLWLALMIALLVKMGPWRTGVLCQGFSPDGREYCVVQSHEVLFEFRVSFYLRNAEGVWQWHYLAHDDDSWRSASVEFTSETIRITREGKFEREFPRGAGTPRGSDSGEYNQPAWATVAEVFSAHDR